MPRYYMHLIDGGARLVDVEGAECADLDAARALAIQGIRSIVAEAFLQGNTCSLSSVEVCNADGHLLSPVSVGEAVAETLEGILSIVGAREPASLEQ